MYRYPNALQNLINELSHLPGVGAKAAQRLAFHLLSRPKDEAIALSAALANIHDHVSPCPVCGNFTDAPLCPICADDSRERNLLCVVEGVADIIALERSGNYRGLYHVLGGVISPMDGVGPAELKLDVFFRRVEEGGFNEVIMATNPTAEGEATALYLAKKLHPMGLRVSRLAHGMPMGGSLAFTDEATVDMALSGRREI